MSIQYSAIAGSNCLTDHAINHSASRPSPIFPSASFIFHVAFLAEKKNGTKLSLLTLIVHLEEGGSA